MELYQKAIEKYMLNFSIKIEEVEPTLKKLVDIYKLQSINEAFFYFIKNEIGSELDHTGHDNSDFLAWLKIVKKDNADWYYFIFDSDDDYYDYKGHRNFIYKSVTYTTLLNFFEQNCVNFVADKKLKTTN